MPPVRTFKSHDKSDVKMKRPSIARMSISVSRVKPYTGTRWNAQIRAWRCRGKPDENAKHIKLQCLLFKELRGLIADDLTDLIIAEEEDGIERDGKTMSLVWRMSESGQLGRVYDDDSFQSAVQDHRCQSKNIVQLYIIHSKGE